MAKVLAIPDLHFPWVSTQALSRLHKVLRMEKPDIVIQLGDIYDQYVFSRFDRSFELIAPKEEIACARAMAKTFWLKVQKACPKAKYVQLMGNHDIRFAKKILQKLPELAYEIDDLRNKYYSFPGVEILKTERDFIEIDDTIYVHGWLGRKNGHMNHFEKSVVRAHSHAAALYLEQGYSTRYKPLFEMQAGCLIEESMVPFNYTSSKMTKWRHAYGIIEDGFPRLIIL